MEAKQQWALRSRDQVPIQVPLSAAGWCWARYSPFWALVSFSVVMTPNSLGYQRVLKEIVHSKFTPLRGKLPLLWLFCSYWCTARGKIAGSPLEKGFLWRPRPTPGTGTEMSNLKLVTWFMGGSWQVGWTGVGVLFSQGTERFLLQLA